MPTKRADVPPGYEGWTEQREWLKENIDEEALRFFVTDQVRDAQIAHEVVQRAMDSLAAMPLAHLHTVANPQSYALTATRNRLSNWIRDHWKVGEFAVENDERFPEESAELAVQSKEEALELLRMVRETDLEPFILCKLHGYTSKEAANELGISVSLVKKRVARAMHFLNPQGPAPDRRSITTRLRELLSRKERKQ